MHGRVAQFQPSALPGVPGLAEHLTAVPQFRGVGLPDNPAGAIGQYEVRFAFSRTEDVSADREISFDASGGDSNLQWAASPDSDYELLMRLETESDGGKLVFDIRMNTHHRLSRVDTHSFLANGFQDAEDKAYRALAPQLSQWSAETDVPLRIGRVVSKELTTGTQRVSFHAPFRTVAFNPGGFGRISEDLRFYLSLYREGLASNSAAYQFLCFYKIQEGIRRRRARLAQQSRANGGISSREPERIPETRDAIATWLNSLFLTKREWDDLTLAWTVPDEARGKKVGQIFDMVTAVRNKIAHALLNEDEPGHTADEQLNSPEINRWLPLLRCIARWLIKNDFPEFLKGA